MDTLTKIRNSLTQEGIEALIVTKPANIRYLSNFSTPEDGKVLITQDHAVLITDGRYIAQAKEEVDIEVAIDIDRDWIKLMIDNYLGTQALSFESDAMTVANADLLNAKFTEHKLAAPKACSGIIEKARLYKTAAELDKMREAAKLGDEAFSHILEFIKVGMKEVEVALELERYMRTKGAESVSFEIIVASGHRSAMPHGLASQKEIQSGELVTLDFGCVIDGYHSDMTRTFGMGKVSDEHRKIYDTVLEAEETALAAVAPNKKGVDIDGIARNIITEAGYGDYFPHGLGHGVGLEIHEAPNLSPRQPDIVLEPGMTVTVEPGIYIPGDAGVRIEDLAVVTETGAERLCFSDKTFIEL